MKNITSKIEVTPLVMPDGSVRIFISRVGEDFSFNDFTIPGVKAKRMVVIDGSDSTDFVEYDMGDWILEVAQTDEDDRVYVFSRYAKTHNPIQYAEVDVKGNVIE